MHVGAWVYLVWPIIVHGILCTCDSVCVCGRGGGRWMGGRGGGAHALRELLFLGRLSQRTFEDPSRLQSVKSIEEEP